MSGSLYIPKRPSRSLQAEGLMRFSSSQLLLHEGSSGLDRTRTITAIALWSQTPRSHSAHSPTVTSVLHASSLSCPRSRGSGTPPCPLSHRASGLNCIPGPDSSRAEWVLTWSLAFTFDSTFSYFWDFQRAFTGLGLLCSWARSFSLYFFWISFILLTFSFS